jgi:hypothetical protein
LIKECTFSALMGGEFTGAEPDVRGGSSKTLELGLGERGKHGEIASMSSTANMMCSSPCRRSLVIATLEGTLVCPALVDRDGLQPKVDSAMLAKISTGVVAY